MSPVVSPKKNSRTRKSTVKIRQKTPLNSKGSVIRLDLSSTTPPLFPVNPAAEPGEISYTGSREISDITIFVDPEKHPDFAAKCGKSEECEIEVILSKDASGVILSSYTGRALIASCCNGERLSITIRQNNKQEILFATKPESQASLAEYKKVDPPDPAAIAASPFAPNGDKDDQYTYTIHHLYNIIKKFRKELLGEDVSHKGVLKGGLIVVSGRTASGKSQLARALIADALSQSLDNSDRFPHLITIEDPIEKRLYGDKKPEEIQDLYGIDYTPRHKKFDFNPERGKTVLQQALGLDALRQTPSVIYVGETREEADWKEVLRYAETGQLIVTTTHAGSVRETLQKILASVNATTRADEGRYAGLINGIIHMEKMKVKDSQYGFVPAIWLGNIAGISALIADGLSSVLPNTTDISYSIGRTWFLRQLCQDSSVEVDVLKRDLFDR